MAWQTTLEPTTAAVFEDEVVNTAQVLSFIGVSRPTLEKAVKEGRFPTPLPFCSHKRWSKRVIMEWIQEQHATATDNGKSKTA